MASTDRILLGASRTLFTLRAASLVPVPPCAFDVRKDEGRAGQMLVQLRDQLSQLLPIGWTGLPWHAIELARKRLEVAAQPRELIVRLGQRLDSILAGNRGATLLYGTKNGCQVVRRGQTCGSSLSAQGFTIRTVQAHMDVLGPRTSHLRTRQGRCSLHVGRIGYPAHGLSDELTQRDRALFASIRTPAFKGLRPTRQINVKVTACHLALAYPSPCPQSCHELIGRAYPLLTLLPAPSFAPPHRQSIGSCKPARQNTGKTVDPRVLLQANRHCRRARAVDLRARQTASGSQGTAGIFARKCRGAPLTNARARSQPNSKDGAIGGSKRRSAFGRRSLEPH